MTSFEAYFEADLKADTEQTPYAFCMSAQGCNPFSMTHEVTSHTLVLVIVTEKLLVLLPPCRSMQR